MDSDSSWDSHLLASNQILCSEISLLLRDPLALNMDFRRDMSQEFTEEQMALRGGPPRVSGRHPLVYEQGIVTPQQLGYGTWTPSSLGVENPGGIYTGSPPGTASGIARRPALEYGYGWVDAYMDQNLSRQTQRAGLNRGAGVRRRLMGSNVNQLEPLTEETSRPANLVNISNNIDNIPANIQANTVNLSANPVNIPELPINTSENPANILADVMSSTANLNTERGNRFPPSPIVEPAQAGMLDINQMHFWHNLTAPPESTTEIPPGRPTVTPPDNASVSDAESNVEQTEGMLNRLIDRFAHILSENQREQAREGERRNEEIIGIMRDQSRAIQTQMAQAPQLIRDVLTNHNSTYMQNVNIKLAGVDPFNPDRSKGNFKSNERTESDVRIFLSKILPTLMQQQYAESTRIRTLIAYCRGSARDYLSNYPQDGSIPFRTIVNDLDYFFQSRETSHTLMKQLNEAVRKPGNTILQYCLYLKKIAENLKKVDATMGQSTVNIIWFKLLNECPSELRAAIQLRFETDQIHDIIAYIGNYTANYPDKSPFTQAKLANEKKEADKKLKYKNNSKNTVTTAAIAAPPLESVYVIECFNCKKPGHMARDCPDGGQTQTIPKERSGTFKQKSKLSTKPGTSKTYSKTFTKKCSICLMGNHTLEYCRVLDRIKHLLKNNVVGAKVNFMGLAQQDPWGEELAPLRDILCQDINWEDCHVDPKNVDEILTAALTCQNIWDWSESSSNESSDEE